MKNNILIDNTTYKSNSYNERKNNNIEFIILHYTVINFSMTIEYFLDESREVSSHYVIADDDNSSETNIFQLVDDRFKAWHAGVSAWKNFENLNENSIGIEIVNQGNEIDKNFQDFTEKQIASLILLLRQLANKYNIKAENIIGHSDIAPLRKIDPGPKMPWRRLWQEGLAFWYDEEKKKNIEKELDCNSSSNIADLDNLRRKLYDFGYKKIYEYDENEFCSLIKIFQMRFRQNKYDGKIDNETIAIINSLS